MATIQPVDLVNAKANTDFIERFATSTSLTTTDRLGRTRKTLDGVLFELNAVAIATETYQNKIAAEAARIGAETARDAANTAGRVFTSQALGIAGTTSGLSFNVPSADGLTLDTYKNNAGTAQLLASFYTKVFADRLAADSGNIFTLAIRPGYMNASSPPAYVADANWLTSDRIVVRPGMRIRYDVFAFSAITIFAFYDAGGTLVGTPIKGKGGSGQQQTGVVIPPATAKTMVMSFANPTQAGATAAENVVFLYSNDSAAIGPTDNLAGDMVRFVKFPGFVTTDGGAPNTNSNWLRSDPIEVVGGRFIDYDVFADTGMNILSFYDATMTFISGVAGRTPGGRKTASVRIPTNAVWATLCRGNTESPSNTLAGGGLPYAGESIVPSFRYCTASAIKATANAEYFADNMFGLAYRPGYMTAAAAPVFKPDDKWLTSDRIKVKPGLILKYNVFAFNAISMFTFYDVNGDVVGSPVLGAGGASRAQVAFTAVPANADTMIMSYSNPTQAGAGVAEHTVVCLTNDAGLIKTTEDFAGEFSRFVKQTGYVTTGGGDSADDPNWLRSNFIEVKPGRWIDYETYAGPGMNIVSFYDSAIAFIKGEAGAAPAGRKFSSVQVPANAVWARLCRGNLENTGNNLGYTGEAFTPRFRYSSTRAAPLAVPLILPSQGVMRYGDSRSSTDYPFVKTNAERVFGVRAASTGFPGATVAALADNAKLQYIFDYVPRIVILMLLGNVSGAPGSVGTFGAGTPNGIGGEAVVATSDGATYDGTKDVQAVDYIVRKIQSYFYNIRTRAALTGSETEAQKNDKIRAVVQPIIVLLTDLPQQRTNSADPYSLPANWERKRQCILEVAAKRKVRCVDTMAMDIDMSVEPFFTAPTNIVNNNGVWYMDGLHANEFLDLKVLEKTRSDAGLIW